MPLFPTTVAFCYGMTEEMWNACLKEIHALHFEPVHVPSAVFDINMEPAPYAEVRGFWSPEVQSAICLSSAANKLKDYMDVEMFSVNNGQIRMRFWPKGSSGDSTDDE